MATCGYLCPKCEGRGFLDSGDSCDWCSDSQESDTSKDQAIEDWINEVHLNPCCGDLGLKNDQE